MTGGGITMANFKDIIGQQQVKNHLQSAIKQNNISQLMLAFSWVIYFISGWLCDFACIHDLQISHASIPSLRFSHWIVCAIASDTVLLPEPFSPHNI